MAGVRRMPPGWALFGAGSALVAGTGSASVLELAGRLIGPVALVLLFRIEPLRAVAAAVAGFLLLIALTRDAGWAVRTALPVGLSGLLMARGLAIGLRPRRIVGEASLPFLFVTLFLFLTPTPEAERAMEVEQIVQGSLALNQDLGRDAASVEMMENMTRSMVGVAYTVIPGAMLVYLFGLTIFAYGIAGAATRRYGFAAAPVGPLSRWKTPFGMVWVFAAGLALTLLGSGMGKAAGANLLFIGCAVYFVQGLAILTWGFQKKGISLLLRVVFYLVAVLLVFPFFILATVSTGLFDTWFDFRRLERSPESEE